MTTLLMRFWKCFTREVLGRKPDPELVVDRTSGICLCGGWLRLPPGSTCPNCVRGGCGSLTVLCDGEVPALTCDHRDTMPLGFDLACPECFPFLMAAGRGPDSPPSSPPSGHARTCAWHLGTYATCDCGYEASSYDH